MTLSSSNAGGGAQLGKFLSTFKYHPPPHSQPLGPSPVVHSQGGNQQIRDNYVALQLTNEASFQSVTSFRLVKGSHGSSHLKLPIQLKSSYPTYYKWLMWGWENIITGEQTPKVYISIVSCLCVECVKACDSRVILKKKLRNTD